jgi:hypothetical protein
MISQLHGVDAMVTGTRDPVVRDQLVQAIMEERWRLAKRARSGI